MNLAWRTDQRVPQDVFGTKAKQGADVEVPLKSTPGSNLSTHLT